jgi:hypothetical protein
MFQTKVVEKIKTHILYSITFFENRSVCETAWKKFVEAKRPQMTIWRKITNTHSEYAIFIAYPLQQWSHERASMLGYIYTASHIISQAVIF